MRTSTRHRWKCLVRAVTSALLCGVLALRCSGPRASQEADEAETDADRRVYDVQLHMTEEKDEASEVLGRAVQWWRHWSSPERPALVQGAPSATKAVTMEWKAPLYRVRLGPFDTRAQAEWVLSEARTKFPDAFVAPDRLRSP